MSFVEKDGKVTLTVPNELKMICGNMDISINNILFEKAAVLWDTGATDTVISEELLDKIPEAKLDFSTMTTIGGPVFNYFFEGNIKLCGVELKNLRIVIKDGLKKEQKLDVVLGMDIIQHGKMIIDGTKKEKSFEFSFKK